MEEKLGAAANLIVAVAYLAIATASVRPLIVSNQWKSNRIITDRLGEAGSAIELGPDDLVRARAATVRHG